jgi:hypothetical protein
MNCYNNPGAEAIGTCTVCGKAICQACAVDVSGKFTCQQCLASGKVPSPYQNPNVKPTNIIAVISLVLGVLGLCGSFPFSIVAWILGHIAQKQILENPYQEGMQYAKIGKTLGIVSTILWAVGIICYFIFLFFLLINSSSYSY